MIKRDSLLGRGLAWALGRLQWLSSLWERVQGSRMHKEEEMDKTDKMNKDASDFMLEEYDRISTAFFGLRDQVNDWFKAYITLVALPITILTAILKLGEGAPLVTISTLPSLVSGVLILVSVLGLFVVLSTVAMRMEMILYARTINGVRRYFAALDQSQCAQAQARGGPRPHELVPFLILPTSDAKPPFFESWRAMFWQVIFIGLVDGSILAVALLSLLKLHWIWSILAGVLYCLLHVGVYAALAAWHKHRWGKPRWEHSLHPLADKPEANLSARW